jgi:hypothetical protein
VRPRVSNPLRVAVPAGLLVVLLSIGVLAATASQPGRSSLLRALRRPASVATASVGPGRVFTVMPAGLDRLLLRLTPNRAGMRDHLALALTTGARPLVGAKITVVFSMPVMNMWQALTTQLVPHGNGTYSADEPVLGMAGLWQMRVHVAPRDAPALDLTVDDNVRS